MISVMFLLLSACSDNEKVTDEEAKINDAPTVVDSEIDIEETNIDLSEIIEYYDNQNIIDSNGEMKIVFNNEQIDETKALGDVNVTLKGYQITEFTPGSKGKDRLSEGENTIRFLIADFALENNSVELISKINVTELMAGEEAPLPFDFNFSTEEMEIPAGNSGEVYAVYILDGPYYQKWRDQQVEIRYGELVNPMTGRTGHLSNDTVSFTLPH